MKNAIKILSLIIIVLFSVIVLKAQPKPKAITNKSLEIKTKANAEKPTAKTTNETTLGQQNAKTTQQKQETVKHKTEIVW